jgi:cell division protein ZapE
MPSLAGRWPEISGAELIDALVPPPLFAAARFDTYRPDQQHPSQAVAVEAARSLLGAIPPEREKRGLLRRKVPATPLGAYFDGGFGVGKTHLLAALWHAAPAPKAYATFVELTSLTGVLGMNATVSALASYRLLAIDEFELDDPGDTVLISTLLGRLSEHGVSLAATSNTQPEDLGEGRFAADDFRREIQGLASRFQIIRVDGPDYRQRGIGSTGPLPSVDNSRLARALATPGATVDDFDTLCAHLAELHPSRYGRLVEGVPMVALRHLRPLTDQAAALRLVVFIDRLYDRGIPVAITGCPLGELFPSELLTGAHRKKYQRCLSRLGALSLRAAGTVEAGDQEGDVQ